MRPKLAEPGRDDDDADDGRDDAREPSLPEPGRERTT